MNVVYKYTCKYMMYVEHNIVHYNMSICTLIP